MNDTCLIDYTLRDRRNALEGAIRPVPRRLEIHDYTEGTNVDDIKTKLRKVIAEASEGLVIKNPRSKYHLGDRNDDWMKVKPDYMKEMGENLDLLIIGGYYGEGRRGGKLSSFLLGLRADNVSPNPDGNAKFYSFCKVGGGFSALDYSKIRHLTEGKWVKWNPQRPPVDYYELAGGQAQYERPDEWIKPENSIVISIKGAAVTVSDQFRIGMTLRFPRFTKLRDDRFWDTSMSTRDFRNMKVRMDEDRHENELQIDQRRRATKRVRKEFKIAGADAIVEPLEVNNDNLFKDMNFCVFKSLCFTPP